MAWCSSSPWTVIVAKQSHSPQGCGQTSSFPEEKWRVLRSLVMNYHLSLIFPKPLGSHHCSVTFFTRAFLYHDLIERMKSWPALLGTLSSCEGISSEWMRNEEWRKLVEAGVKAQLLVIYHLILWARIDWKPGNCFLPTCVDSFFLSPCKEGRGTFVKLHSLLFFSFDPWLRQWVDINE